MGDGETLCTTAIQAALDAAAEAGGGVVRIAQGTYLSGTIFLRSRVTLEILPGAVLLGSPRIEDYPPQDWPVWWPYQKSYNWAHLIIAEEVEDITICGGGEINGNGHHFWQEMPKPGERRWIPYKLPRPERMLMFRKCANVRVRDIRLEHSPAWNVQFFECDRCFVSGVQVRGERFGPNIDGFDVQGCRDMMFSDCNIDTGDDAFVMFPSADRDCERVTVTNCTIRTNCVAFKAYLFNRRAARDLVFSNSVVHHTPRAVGLYAFDHGLIENVTVSNITVDTDSTYWLNRALTIEAKHCDRAVDSDETEKRGTIRNVSMSNCVIRSDGRLLFSASDEMSIQNISLRDIVLDYPVIDDASISGKDVDSESCMDHSDGGRMARAAVVVENIQGLAIENLQIRWPETDPFRKWGGLQNNQGESIPYPGEENPPFSVIYSRDVTNAVFDNPLANPHKVAEKYDIEDSEVTVRG